MGEKWPKSGSKFEKMAQKNLIGENGGERKINPSANPASAIKFVFSFIPNQSNSEVGSQMLFTIVFLSLINGKSVAHLFQTIIR